MNKGFKRIITSLSVLFLAAVVLFSDCLVVKADSPYKTYTIDGYGDVSETQTAYLPYKTITKIGEEAMLAPTDMCITEDQLIYVLDGGNKRVLVSTIDGEFVKAFGSDILVNPMGIYVTDDHTVYVADKDASKIFVFDEAGTLITSYGKPDHPLYGETLAFLPLKIVVNDAGTMYVICESNTNGIVEISPVENGTFLGYFGTNSTKASLWKIMWRAIQTKEQRAKSVSNIPSTPDNMAIDEKGLIYTVTRGEKNNTLKRLNIAGGNMIKPDSYDDVPAAVAVGNHDNAFVVSAQGFIYEYNNEGELLFAFGGSDDGQSRIGLSTKISAIQVDKNDRIYTLDTDKAEIQIYEPTEFTKYLHNALYLFSKGRYTESKEPLEKVLTMNNLFDYANMAMGKALYQEENYEAAIEYSKLAKDADGYSDSFWELRNMWLKRNLTFIIIGILVIVALKKGISILDKKKGILDKPRKLLTKFRNKKLVSEIRYMFFFMRHPIDGCYGIKKEGRISVLSSNILLAVGTLFYIIYKYFCGFLFKTTREGRYDILADIGKILVLLIMIVGCNYLICTINDGEGKFKHIYCSFIYCFAPYLVFKPFTFVVTHLITYNEKFLIEFADFFMWAWIALLVFLAIKEINNYTVKETIKIIFLTIFTILILSLLIFIMYVLWSQVFDFLQSIAGEVVYKIGN